MAAPPEPVTRRAQTILALALATAGAISIGDGLYLWGKAHLAQVLLADAWRRARNGEARPVPWPWADTWPVARLRAPSRAVDLIVLAGASGRTLAFGPGHLSGSGVLGGAENAVVAGHRDTHFAFLRTLTPGDTLTLELPGGQTRSYRVFTVGVVHQGDLRWLEPTGLPTLTLLTCYPFAAIVPGGPLRWVVRAQ